MAPRARRPSHVNQVPDSESDDEDQHVVNDSRTQPIDLSDDEDNIPSAPGVPLPQQVPTARHPVEQLLQSRGVRPRTQWLDSCLNDLAASHPGFARLPVHKKAELCFGQFLMADFNSAGAASLPPSMHTLHGTELPGPFVLQVDEVTDVSRSLRDRYQEKPAGPGRTLKLSMTDGVQRVSGMEYRPIRALQVLSPAGMKISLKNVCVRRGLLMLVPEILEVLGGQVEHLESARLRAVQLINKPPRGRRTREGTAEPSLAERATSAAWPPNSSAGAVNNHHPEQHRSHAVLGEDQGSRSSNSVSDHPVNHSLRAAVQQGAGHGNVQQGRPAQSRGPSVQASHIQQSVRLPPVQQELQQQPMQQGQFTNPSRISEVNSTGLETVQQAGHQQPVEHHQVVESAKESSRVSGVHSARMEQVYQVEQSRMVQQGQGAEASRQSSTQVSSQNNGRTPTYGRLSLQSRRLVQSKLPMALTTKQPQADDHPLRSTGAGDVVTPMELDDCLESGQHMAALSSTPPSMIDSFGDRVPFTYLTILKDRSNSRMGRHGVVRGKVKCVITGVTSFQYRDVDEFKLHVHIEDGSGITAAYVQHQLVQRLVGCSPRAVVSGLGDPDTHQEMVDNMLRFQKLLERFEGFMDVEFSNSSVVVIVQMTNGVQLADVKLLFDRVHGSTYKQTPNNTNGLRIPTIDLSTP